MDIKQMNIELEKLQITYQKLINENIPQSGDLNDLDEKIKDNLLFLRDKIRVLRKKISDIEKKQNEDVVYLQKLKKKFT